MEITTTYKTIAEHQRVYDLIWSQMPHMQNATSSSWWFFLMFPKGEEGYGPRQLMFTIAARAGRRVKISDVWLPGIDLKRPIEDGVDRFDAIAVGWYCDGETVHDDIVKIAAPTTLSAPDSYIECLANGAEGQPRGTTFRRAANRPLALAARIRGEQGAADFEAWGDLDSLDSSPHEAISIDTPVGGTHFVAWRRMHFEGEFDLPTGQERLEGICYFQRVCMNAPTFPWKWIWSLFPDGSMFSAFAPYLGFNLTRKGYKFFDSNRKEQAALGIFPKAFWDPPGPPERIWFKKGVKVTPILGQGPHPQFAVTARNGQGDHLSFLAAPYGHTHFFIDRPLLGGRLSSHWHYNEYMFRMEQLQGTVAGRTIDKETMGQGFGNLEYAWGLGL